MPVTRALRHVVRALFELYAYDFSSFTGADVNEAGRYTDADFLRGWRYNGDQDTWLFLLRVAGHWAGFAWVGRGSFVMPEAAHAHWLMEEFFILRKYRRQGHGTWLAGQVFARFPGTWEVGELAANIPAQHFWRTVIQRLVGSFEEHCVNNARWQGIVQIFQCHSGCQEQPQAGA
ncbi:MAG: hypothetical protein NZL91_06135 [Thermoflexales bacterium]|nr:hypothetical protein [Thermoflexales bacterium]MCS7324649.1 hypothetical protein [Thermoflexales bacterium]MCX7938491.1 hypothetical protein [Thermoflexales bacterium]MDW8053160.1 GNAT family N-acetyltransferase [Anaerolineae bacterium]MDW8291812.1 GNAT family N-acetyltransferase [Anaerolineae bacterium]